MASRKSSYYKQNKAAIKRKLKIDTSGKETGASKGRRFVLWGGITAIIALFVVVGTAGIGSMIAPPTQVVLTSESHAITVFSSNGSKIPFASTSSGEAEYTTSSNTTYILTNVTMGEMAHNNVGKMAVNLTAGAVFPSTVTTPISLSTISPDVSGGTTYSVNFTEKNLTHLSSTNYWQIDICNTGTGALYDSPKEYNTSFTYALVNGTYTFKAYAPTGTFLYPFTTSFTVSGHNLKILVPFEYKYNADVIVKNLPANATRIDVATGVFSLLKLPSNSTYSGSNFQCSFPGTATSPPLQSNISLTNGTYNAYFYTCSSNCSYLPYLILPQTFTINGANLSLNFSVSKGYPISFKETGLPLKISWNVNAYINGAYDTFQTINTSSTYYLLNGTYGIVGNAANSTTGVKYASIYQPLTINGDPTVNLTFTNAYTLTIDETGLLAGTSWTVHLSTGQNLTSSTTSLSATLAKDTYNYTITASGYQTLEGTISLTANKTLNVTFNPAYNVTFNEKGLPTGKSWMVLASHNVSGGAVAGRVITLVLFNGSYSYQILTNDTAVAAFPGHFTVAGHNLEVNVTFNLAYNVTFHETGLPANTMWFVNLTVNGATETVFNTNTSKITANMSAPLSNATYLYTGFGFNNTTKYLYMTTFGNFTVKGASLTVNLTFARAYAIIFLEKGLPSNTAWNIVLNTGQTLTSAPLKLNNTTNTLAVFGFLMEGNYTYTPRISIAGYTGAPGKFDLTNNTMVNVTFTQVLPPPPLIKATITIGFGTSVSNFVPIVSNVTNISYAMLLIQPYYLTGNQSEHLMIEVNTSAPGLKYVTFELLGNTGPFSSFGPIHAEDFGYVVGGTIILALTLVTVPWIAIYREQWIMSERKVK